MAAGSGFVAHVEELLAPLGVLRAKRMFGVVGLYLDEVFFGIVAEDALWLRVDEQTTEAFTDAGSEPYRFSMPDGREVPLSFWRAPEEALEEPESAQHWARLSLEAALRVKARRGRRRAKA